MINVWWQFHSEERRFKKAFHMISRKNMQSTKQTQQIIIGFLLNQGNGRQKHLFWVSSDEVTV